MLVFTAKPVPALLAGRRGGEEEKEEEKEEEEEEEEGAVFDKPDSQTQTHAQRESYCLDPGGFSIQQCVCKCHLVFCPNMLF